jgi:hypothetical protein
VVTPVGRPEVIVSTPCATLAIVPLFLIGCAAAPERANQEVVVNDDAAVIYTGTFTPIDYAAAGTLRIEVDDDDSARVLFLDDFAIGNGPALVVGLSTRDVEGMTSGNAWPADTVELGDLAGASGAQAYPVPAGVDVEAFRSVVVWCDEFAVAFGAASFGRDG